MTLNHASFLMARRPPVHALCVSLLVLSYLVKSSLSFPVTSRAVVMCLHVVVVGIVLGFLRHGDRAMWFRGYALPSVHCGGMFSFLHFACLNLIQSPLKFSAEGTTILSAILGLISLCCH